MGGHAVQNARRWAHDEFIVKATEVVDALRVALPEVRIDLIPSYDKPDYGDADLLVESDKLTSDWMTRVRTALSPAEVVHNGDVWSLDVDRLQVDLIVTPGYQYGFAYRYFSYNDVGNLVGRVAHRAGFKLGHKGLFKCLRDGDYLHDEVLVTRDFAMALAFFGYDYLPYFNGFKRLNEIFEYVVSSPYFDAYSYDLGNMSHKARVRDKKRPTYQSFLKWLDERQYVGKVPRIVRSHEEWLDLAKNEFPAFVERWAQAEDSLARRKAVKSRFNGEVVSQLTGLSGKNLGGFMVFLRQRPNLVEFLLSASQEEVYNWISEQLSEYQG